MGRTSCFNRLQFLYEDPLQKFRQIIFEKRFGYTSPLRNISIQVRYASVCSKKKVFWDIFFYSQKTFVG